MAPKTQYAESLGQRTERGIALDRKVNALHAARTEQPDLFRAAEERIVKLQATPGAVTQAQTLQELSIAYVNDDYIGERLMPPVSVNKLAANYWSRPQRDGYSYPNPAIGPDGSVQTVSQDVTNTPVALVPQAYKEYLDVWTMDEADSVVLELIDPTMNVLDALALWREQQIATVLTTAANFGANTAAIAAAVRWNTANGNPIANVATAKAACWTGNGPGSWVGYCGLNVYNALKTNPMILDQVKYTGGAPAVVTRQAIAALFELDDLVVGAARQNTANEGVAAVYTRMWDANNSFGIVRVANRPSRRSASFGITLEQPTVSSTWFENGRGGKGAYVTQVARADAPVILAAPCGFLYTTVI
jgi:hypothetical protein